MYYGESHLYFLRVLKIPPFPELVKDIRAYLWKNSLLNAEELSSYVTMNRSFHFYLHTWVR